MKYNYFHRFRDLKLRTKFLASFVVVTFIALSMISVLHYYVFTNSIKEISSNSSELLLEQISLNFEQKITEIEETSFLEYKNAGFCSEMIDADSTVNERILMNRSIQKYLYNMIYHFEYIEYAAIFGKNNILYNQHQLGSDYSAQLKYSDFTDTEMMSLDDHRGQTVWEPNNQDTILVKRAMYDINSSAYCGILVLGVKTQYFKEIYEPQSNSNSGELMFLNDQNKLTIYNNEISKRLYEASSGTNSGEFLYNNHRYVLTENKTSDERWTLLNIISFDEFTHFLKDLRYWVFIIFIVAFLLAFINAAVLSKYITKRLNRFVHSMKTISFDGQGEVIRSNAKDEIGMLTNKFNAMVIQIRELINTVSQEKTQKQRAQYKQLEFQYKALQAQMNPHFLYNTLESIQSLAKIRGEQEIAKMIYLLGKLMRGSISRKEDFITLKEEVDFIKDYLSLESIMYESRLHVDYEVDADVLPCIVPRFILQPILENSIVHGIEKKPGKGLIKIRCWSDHGNLVMEVEDNGIGMSEDKIKTLLSEDDVPGERTRVGVKSVHKRLQILFGDSYGINIRSKENVGTTITIVQPIKIDRKGLLDENESGRH